MKNEMDLLKFDETKRQCWLKANRMTLIMVGIVWLSMIGYQMLHSATPYFLIVMVPIFAVIRWLFYEYYKRSAK
ncbi:hypothetical protein JW979_09585 [bacterium]|nr:hypothetical protein [candidate division CSSED10-310 bacterium]